jgi:hypothetical protein
MTRIHDYPANAVTRRVLRVPEETYAELEARTVRHTGLDPDKAQALVDALLGPLRLAPPLEWYEEEHPCPHAYFTEEGEWIFCDEGGEPDHTLHQDLAPFSRVLPWNTGDPRDVDAREWER